MGDLARTIKGVPFRAGAHRVASGAAARAQEGPISTYTRQEELANAITHGIGVVLAVGATVVLAARAVVEADAWKIVTYPVFGLSMILLYTASSLYHSHPDPETRRRLKVFDHMSIYYLIAGTYTPVALVGLQGAWGWAIFGVIWGLAIAGTVFKTFFTGRFPVVSTVLYLAMGWTAIVAVVPLVRTLETDTLIWLLAGGLAYTGGVAFYAWKRLPFNHAIWHLFVLTGTACHVVAVLSL
ncbi:MAG: PAQR family membrane homeostasis protein TrhA [bacterium]